MSAKRLCKRCGHPDSWHSHDDEACLSKHPQPCAPAGCSTPAYPTHDAPFRCLGTDIWKPGFAAGTPESRCGCPDFVEVQP
jgi:hypothetical protein